MVRLTRSDLGGFRVKLHWSPRSPFVRKVMVFAHETGLVGRIETVRTVADMKKPNAVLMKDNPLSKIPTLLTDDGQTLFDSVVICEYFDTLHQGPRLFPEAPARRWQALRWHALTNGLLDHLILWRNESNKPQAQQTPEHLQAFEAKLRATLAMLDDEAKTIGETPVNIGHITIGCALGYLDYRFDALGWRTGHDRIAAWFAGFNARPSMQATLPTD
jgi:glutathione S-transferase